MQETVSIVIPNYNGRKLLEKNLPGIIKLKDKYKEIFDIVIVDDCSTDESYEFLNNSFEDKIVVIKKAFNTGFSDTVNTGIKACKGSLVLLLNTDVRPNPDFLPPLLRYFSNENTFAVGCLDNSVEKGKVIRRGRGIGTFRNGFLMHRRGETDKNNTLWVSGGSSIYRKTILIKLGLFDKVFSPFYWEDIDVSYRALKSGYDIYFEKSSQVTHEHEKGSIKEKYNSSQIRQISMTNQILFVWKNISDSSYVLNHLIFLLKNLFSGNFAFIKAVISAGLKIPEVLINRRKQSKMWILRDNEILKRFESEIK